MRMGILSYQLLASFFSLNSPMELHYFSFGLLSIFILLFFLKSIKNRKTPPGPWKLPFIGSIHHLAGPLPHHTLRKLSRKHGPLMHLQLGELSTIVVSSPRVAKEVMETHDLAFLDRPEILASKIIMYNSTDIAFSRYGDYWKQMRKICTMELLSQKTVCSFSSIREDEVGHLMQSIKSSAGSVINLSEMVDSVNNAITCRAVFGQRCKEQHTLIEAIEQSEIAAGGFDISDLFPSLKVLHILSGLRPTLVKVHQNTDRILDGIVRDREESLTSNGKGEGDEREEDLLDILLKLKENDEHQLRITTDNIKAVIMDLFSAGTGTTMTVIDWAMSEMMKNPKVMENAQAELRHALKPGKEIITDADIQGLSYLKCVIKETLRLHPAAPLLLPRVCTQQCDIDGYTIPVNTRVIVNAWAIGRDPEYWHDPESFQPQRFKNVSIGFKDNDCQYIPFGAGRRMCPGSSFGLAIVELFLAQLLYHFDWKLPNGMKPSELDMSEKFGATTRRSHSLCLIATSHT